MKVSHRILFASLLIAGLITAVEAQSRRPNEESDRGSALRMRDTTIEGERPTPDVFFILPTGKGGNLRVPHRRDYSSEILEPVVKPWLEKDDNVSLATIQHVTRGGSDWKAALDAPAPAPPPSEPALEPVRPPSRELPPIPPASASRPLDVPETARRPPARPLPPISRPSLPPLPPLPPASAAPRAAPPPPPPPTSRPVAAAPPTPVPRQYGQPTSPDVPILVPPQ